MLITATNNQSGTPIDGKCGKVVSCAATNTTKIVRNWRPTRNLFITNYVNKEQLEFSLPFKVVPRDDQRVRFESARVRLAPALHGISASGNSGDVQALEVREQNDADDQRAEQHSRRPRHARQT